MKKILFIAALAGLSFASCKKEYTCECTYSGGGVSGTASETYSKMKKKDAEKKCDENDETGSATTVDCSIK